MEALGPQTNLKSGEASGWAGTRAAGKREPAASKVVRARVGTEGRFCLCRERASINPQRRAEKAGLAGRSGGRYPQGVKNTNTDINIFICDYCLFI